MSGRAESGEPDRGDGEREQDVEALIARQRAAPRRGTPQGREPAEGTRRLRRLLGLTVALLALSAAVLVVALLLG